jgi:hypothetical protein
VLQAKEHTPTPFSVVFILGLAFESIKEFGGASITMALNGKTYKYSSNFDCFSLQSNAIFGCLNCDYTFM